MLSPVVPEHTTEYFCAISCTPTQRGVLAICPTLTQNCGPERTDCRRYVLEYTFNDHWMILFTTMLHSAFTEGCRAAIQFGPYAGTTDQR
jgi:hypothetical protein